MAAKKPPAKNAVQKKETKTAKNDAPVKNVAKPSSKSKEVAPALSKSVVAHTSTEIKAVPEKKKEVAKTGVVLPIKPLPKKAEKKTDGTETVLFVCSEAYPFAGTGGLGEVMGSLPRTINTYKDSGFEARIILPLYDSFPYEEREKLEFICHINVPVSWRNQYCGLFKYDYNGTIYYFIDNEYYFKRSNLYGYYDDGERFAYFSRAVLEMLPHLGKMPKILHCNDWQTALVSVYYKLYYMRRAGYENIKNVFTIHNIEYQGKYSKSIIEDVFGISYSEYASLEFGGGINLMKAAMDYCDSLMTVSPTYADELGNPYYSHGLDGVVNRNREKLKGILNGIDTDSYNPAANPALFENYSDKNVKEGKARNKQELQKMLSLPVNPSVPLIAIISRLVTHKGLDLIRSAMNEILNRDVQIVVLGKGDPDYEGYFTHIQKTYDQKISTVITFNKDLSHKIYAAADLFLMPSKSEPCGLSQMMACRYGTIPVVRATGGLKDSVSDCQSGDTGNGFVFNNYDAGEMLHAIDRAIGLYYDYKDKWDGLVKRAMATDFSWSKSAVEYIEHYKKLIGAAK